MPDILIKSVGFYFGLSGLCGFRNYLGWVKYNVNKIILIIRSAIIK